MAAPNPLSERILEGDGSRERPFVIHTSSHVLSASIQAEIIDKMYGKGTYSARENSRLYYASDRGLPGNGDLCEHKIVVDGRPASVWFDLYMVTRLVNDPELKKAKAEMLNSPAGRKTQAAIRELMVEKMRLQSSGGASKPGSCFVATAVYGDYEHNAVRVLRRFRDARLNQSSSGRFFIRVYYRVGPAMGRVVVRYGSLRKIARLALDWIVAILAKR